MPTCRRLTGESCGRGPMSESSASDERIEFNPPEPSLWTRLDKHLSVQVVQETYPRTVYYIVTYTKYLKNLLIFVIYFSKIS